MSNKFTNEEIKQRTKVKLKEAEIERVAGKLLLKHYHGYTWYTDCSIPGGVLNVMNLSLNGDYGFVVHLKDLMTDVAGQCIVHAGGELLERCGLPATRRPKGDGLKDIERDARGEAQGDRYMTGGEH